MSFMNNLMINYIFGFSVFASLLWFYYYFGLYFLSTPTPTKKYKGRKALIVPVYNENSKELTDTINSVKRVRHEFDAILFVNDGSTNDVAEVLKKNLEEKEYYNMFRNRGKREAQAKGIQLLTDCYGKDYFDSFVMMDSDTVLTRTSVRNLCRKMVFEDVGGVTAQILVKNKTTNFLTRCMSAMYWSSSNIWRQAPANYGYQQVMNGQLTVYRAKPIIELLPKYITQTFRGVKCTYSDDRWLTHHLQTDFGLRMEYEREAIAYTYVPETFKGAWKMLMRWKKGSLRETLLVTKHFFRKPLLVLDCWWNHLVSIGQLIIRIIVVVIAFSFPLVLLYYFMIIAMISVVYGFDMLIRNPKEIPYRVGWSFLNEFYFGFIIVGAIFGLQRQSWETR